MTQNRSAQSHRAAGIKKRPSTAYYPADVLADPSIIACHGLTRGAWLQSLNMIMREDSFSTKNTVSGFARAWGMSEEEALRCIIELIENKPCDIIIGADRVPKNQHVTEGHIKKIKKGEYVTLINRRRERAQKEREQERLRKRKQREREKSRICPEHVNNRKEVSSSSSSSSPSLSKDNNGGSPPIIFISELKEKRDACKQMLQDSIEKNDSESSKIYRKRVKTLNKQIADYGEI